MAQAWLDARDDLGIRVIHPFRFTASSGQVVETHGVYLPDFGSPSGTVLLCRWDPEGLDELLDATDYFSSGLSPGFYEPYRRDKYVQTLSDWGWYGPLSESPDWYNPNWRSGIEAHEEE